MKLKELEAEQQKRIKERNSEWMEENMRQRVERFTELMKLASKMENPRGWPILAIAEEMACLEGVCPPDWMSWVNCERCGPMPCFVGEGEAVNCCPWCDTPCGKACQEAKQSKEGSKVSIRRIVEEIKGGYHANRDY